MREERKKNKKAKRAAKQKTKSAEIEKDVKELQAVSEDRPFNSSHGRGNPDEVAPPAIPGYAAPGAMEEMPEG